MSEQKDNELTIETSRNTESADDTNHVDCANTADSDNKNIPEDTVKEEPAPSWQMERPNPEQQIPSWQGQQQEPGQPAPSRQEQQKESGQPAPSWQGQQQNSGQTNIPWQGQPPYPGQPYPGQQNPEQQNAPWQNQQPYPGQPNAPWQNQQPYPGQPNVPWQNQQPYPGQPYPEQPIPGQPYPGQPIPGQPYPGQQNPEQPSVPWQNQQFPNVPPSGSGNFYPNQNPNFQNPNMQNMPNQNMPNQNIPTPNLPNSNFQGQQGMSKPPVNPMAVTSLVLGIISLLVSCCCFPIGFIIGFVLAMIGLVLAISSKKGKPFSGYAIAGLVLSILGICESLFLFLSYLITARMMQDPNMSNLMNQIMEQYERSLGPQMISSFLRKLL